jgi:DNA-binding response OmpR family regulator
VAHILVVEDDPRVLTAVLRALGDEGFAASGASTALAGLETATRDRPDLVILDLGLPDMDGRDLLRMLRSVSDVPVIVATARDEETDVVAALDSGADDYLVKPFSVGQLAARVRAVLRRTGAERSRTAPVVVASLVIDSAARIASLDGRVLDLSVREFDLLRHLAERAGEVVSKRELLASVWRQPYGGSEKTVDVHLSWLRRKLGETAQRPVYLHTVRGVGVRLDSACDTHGAQGSPEQP